ncbi:thiol:disulfide interchange protein [Paenibacillus anaericanus]|uniref:hypothetical protein n=1 Tax=Paenibacillus anaericanus TaxID=170367 RepID=UPI0027874701|nr:hypothetical protein [Paenibacillus anaericanus]MDQ0091246.1 thiol:disulfide interchange protein [Paenibacillus anaericanus]
MNAETPSVWLWIVVGLLLLSQGTWIFIDARKRGRRAWLWGLWGIINCPTSLIVYLLIVVRPETKKRRDL